MKSLSLKLSEPLAARLGAAARRRRANKSVLVRESLERYLGDEAGGSGLSAHDAAGDLAGCVSGPVDLSTNRKRMRGYGE